jgi:hypothetical protein
MPETLTLKSALDLDAVQLIAAPVQVITHQVEQMIEVAEREAAAAGRKLQRDGWELTGERGTGAAGQPVLMLTLTAVAHLIHVTERDVLRRRWYAVPSEVEVTAPGEEWVSPSWSVATTDVPALEIDQGGTDERVMADCWGEVTARHLADLHNAWLANEKGLDASFMRRLIAFSQRAFGPAKRTKGLLDHLRKELIEVEKEPDDLDEWVDVVILGLDGAWRHGGTPQGIIDRIVAKVARNEARTWPDWRTASEDTAIEHDRTVPEPA